MNEIDKNYSLVKLFESWATVDNPFNSTEEILRWVDEKNSNSKISISKIRYDYNGENWHYDPVNGDIRNKDGTFFTVSGLQIIENDNVLQEQPIIIQDEIGYLGIIGKIFDGVLYFLMQAKIEPGNVNKIQISPTIQATKSNFIRAHGGKTPAYLEYFSNKKNYEIIVDQIQSEQSSRFLGKRNRNIIIVVNDDIEVLDSHRWMTLGQIKQLMHYDNLVNMDTRSVISCIPFSLRDFSYKELSHIYKLFSDESLYNSMFFGNPGYNINKIFQSINEIKMSDNSKRHLVDLYQLKQWHFTDEMEFASPHGDFKLVYCKIDIEGREVRRWEQPLLEAEGSSIFGLMYYIENGKKQFIIQAISEVGCFDKIEIGPSVQLGPNEIEFDAVSKLFIRNLNDNRRVVFSGLFSEEGGRFYQEQNRNVLMEIDKNDLPDLLPDRYFLADYQTLNILIQFNNCLNIQLRNLLSILSI